MHQKTHNFKIRFTKNTDFCWNYTKLCKKNREKTKWILNKYENKLLKYAQNELLSIEDIVIYGNSEKKAGVVSFNVEGIHPYDVGHILDKQGIAVRTGHHCTQPIMAYFDIPGTVRISFSFYNTISEIDVFIIALKKAISMLK